MISIPTDCPQRERAGWTGDIQIFAPTACYNMRMYSFLNRWMKNVRLEQYDNGGIPNIVPSIPSYNSFNGGEQIPASAGWGDAVVIVPWVLYEQYGNIETLRENYPAMKKWVEYIRICAESGCAPDIYPNDQKRMERQKYLWNTGQNLGDWLIPSLVADGSVENMLKCSYLTHEYVKADGYLGDFQGVYVMALKFHMVSIEKQKKVLNCLIQQIIDNEYRLDTGFVSTPFLLDVLCEHGYQQLAYKLFFQNKCPSWLYEIEHGATTIWENWKAILPDGTVLPVSYNHYAFGCVGEWMYRYLGGIHAAQPGYKKIRIAPHIDCGLSYVKSQHESVFGMIQSEWTIAGNQVNINIQIPENTTAEIVLPKAKGAQVKESGILLSNKPSICVYEKQPDMLCKVGSGNYRFCYQIAE